MPFILSNSFSFLLTSLPRCYNLPFYTSFTSPQALSSSLLLILPLLPHELSMFYLFILLTLFTGSLNCLPLSSLLSNHSFDPSLHFLYTFAKHLSSPVSSLLFPSLNISYYPSLTISQFRSLIIFQQFNIFCALSLILFSLISNYFMFPGRYNFLASPLKLCQCPHNLFSMSFSFHPLCISNHFLNSNYFLIVFLDLA